MKKLKADFNSEAMHEEIRIIVEREARKSPRKMNIELIIDGLDYLHPFDEQEDELRTQVAWIDFQNRCISKCVNRHIHIKTVRTIVIVGFLMVMVLATTMCYALGIDVFSIVVQWTKEQLNISAESTGVVIMEDADGHKNFDDQVREVWGDELCDMLENNGVFIKLPSWKPIGYTLYDTGSNVIGDKQYMVYASYETDSDKYITVIVRHMKDLQLIEGVEWSYEADENLQEVHHVQSRPYYILSNLGVNSLAWCENTCSIVVTGDITIDEIKDMVNSIK